MGASHVHSELPKASERTTTILSVIVGVVVFLTAMGAAAVWPDDFSFRGSLPSTIEGARWVSATIVDVNSDGTVTATINGEEDNGPQDLATLSDPTIVLSPGDHVRALELPNGELGFSDFERASPMLLLFVVYVVLVIGIAWWRGIGALLGLAMAFGVVAFFTVPALFDGGNPLVIGLVTGSGALFALLYLAHGPNAAPPPHTLAPLQVLPSQRPLQCGRLIPPNCLASGAKTACTSNFSPAESRYKAW